MRECVSNLTKNINFSTVCFEAWNFVTKAFKFTHFLLETLSANIDMLMYVRAPDYSDANHHGNIINYIPSIYN